MIRKMQKTELDRVGQIWLQGNLDAHDFIDKNYWIDHLEDVKRQFQQADIFVYSDSDIEGFAGLKDNYIAGIFVDREYRNQGIGRQLLDYLKQNYDQLTLDVYIKNQAACNFYRQNNFKLSFTDIDQENNEQEEQLIWPK